MKMKKESSFKSNAWISLIFYFYNYYQTVLDPFSLLTFSFIESPTKNMLC